MKRPTLKSVALVEILWLLVGVAGADIKDAESATHGADAAVYEVVNTYAYPGYRVTQFILPVLSHYSYVLASGSDAVVIDPGRDAAVYVEFARTQALTIRGVILTHSHADFVAGHMELASSTGAPVYKGAKGGAQFQYQALEDGATLNVGSATLKFIETPGHTPDGMCVYVFSRPENPTPEVIFTGDVLFVGSVGRPDLLEGPMTAAALASASFDTWHEKLSKAGDDALILPAHGAGSLCGAHLSDKSSSTIGAEKASNPYFAHRDRGAYVAAVLEGLPEAPQYFKHNAALNRAGPALVDWSAGAPREMRASAELMDSGKYYVVDLRSAAEYAAGHIPNAVNIGLRGRLETWTGIMVPWDAQLVLVGSQTELTQALHRLHRVGYVIDRGAVGPPGVITMERWNESGLPVATSALTSPEELHKRTQAGSGPVVVDVRLPSEWAALRIGSVVNLPLNHLSTLADKLDPTQPVMTVCNSSYRSSMAVGLLERRGFKHLGSLAGGSDAWISAGLPVLGTAARSTASGGATRPLRLAERIDANDLIALVNDLPGTCELVDIRPATHVAEYTIPGARHVDIADVLDNSAYLNGSAPLIVVDRDGTLAMMVAGALSQKTARPIKALTGGVEAYWESTELGPAVRDVPLPTPAAGQRAAPAAPPPPTVAPSEERPRKKSAGC